MAKRYHNSKSSKSEGSGNKMIQRKVPATIANDPSKFANLPTEPVMELYPKCMYLNPMLDDSIIGIDQQIDNAVSNSARQNARKKY